MIDMEDLRWKIEQEYCSLTTWYLNHLKEKYNITSQKQYAEYVLTWRDPYKSFWHTKKQETKADTLLTINPAVTDRVPISA